MKKTKKIVSVILTVAIIATMLVNSLVFAAEESDVIVSADFNTALAPFVSVEDTGFVANKNVANIASENGQLKYWGIAKDKIIEKNSNVSPITTEEERTLFESKIGGRQKAMSLFSYPPENGSYGARTYLNLDSAVTGRVLISFDIAQGNRSSLNRRVKTTLYLGEEALTATDDIKAVTNSVFQMEPKDETGEAWITDNGQLKVDNANEAITINEQLVTPKFSWPTNIVLQFYPAETVNAAGGTMAGSPVTMKGADRFVKVDLDVDMTKGIIKYYIDGNPAGSAEIADGTLDKLSHIQFYMPSTGWDVSEVFVDNFSIKRVGGKVGMTAAYADGKITVTTDKTIVGAASLSASDFAVKKCADNSETEVSDIEVLGTNSVALSVDGGTLTPGAEYKVIAGDNVAFADGGKAEVASFVIPMTGDGRWTTIFSDDFNFEPANWDENGKWTTETRPESITTEQSPSAKYLWDKGWTVFHNQSKQEIGHNGYITNAIVLEKGAEDNNLRMRFTKDVWRNIYLQYDLEDNDKGASRYRISWAAKFYEVGQPNMTMILLGDDSITESPRNALRYGYDSYSAEAGYGKIISIGADTYLYNGVADDKRTAVLSDITFTDWNTYSLDVDLTAKKASLYVNDMTTPLSVATLNNSVNDLSLVRFAPNATTLELSMDDVKIEKYESVANVESVRFVNQDGEEILPADMVEAGTKAVKIKFSSAVSISDGDITVKQGENAVEVSGYSWDAAANTYTISFTDGLAASGTYTLSVPIAVVTDGYMQSFTTDEGIFDVSKAQILKGGTSAESVSAGDTVTFRTEYINTSAGSETVSLIYAFYSKDESGAMQLLDFDFDEVVADGGHGKDEIVISGITVPQGTAVVKAFVWNGVANGGPLCECTVVE